MEEVEQQLSRGRGEGAVQSSESHMLLERQEQRGYLRGEGHYPDSQRSRAIGGGRKQRGESIFELFMLPLYYRTTPLLLESFTFFFLSISTMTTPGFDTRENNTSQFFSLCTDVVAGESHCSPVCIFNINFSNKYYTFALCTRRDV